MILPLSVILIDGVLIPLSITFFVLKKRKIAWSVVGLIVVFTFWQGLINYKKRIPDLKGLKADIKISATDLIHEYETNDSSANRKFLGKIVEVSGNIKEIKKDDNGYYIVELSGTSTLYSVRCSIDSAHIQEVAKLVRGSLTTIRGACIGFNKDEMGLGSDVILNRSLIIQK